MTRTRSLRIIDNPFIKDENRRWSLEVPSLERSVSPRASRKTIEDRTADEAVKEIGKPSPDTAAVEAGVAKIADHVLFFAEKLFEATRPDIFDLPRLAHEAWLGLYRRNQHPAGHHFVIHQHDHPVAGTHYDLRLQCNETSSISFAIMYGLPGDPNSRRLNRNAAETRVHNVWNHLIETASHSTGTMLIWDTGEYAMLPYRQGDRDSDEDASQTEFAKGSDDSEKLHRAFQQRKIRLRLQGTRLPPDYTLSIRLSKDNLATAQPKKPSRKRKRKGPPPKPQDTPETTNSDSESSKNHHNRKLRSELSSLSRLATPPQKTGDLDMADASSGDESETIRQNNAYTGATNDIGSIHQRKWFLALDRQSSGFVLVPDQVKRVKTWVRRRRSDGTLAGFEKFRVMGRDVERSIVTGRLAKDILADEGVQGYVPRASWRPVTE